MVRKLYESHAQAFVRVIYGLPVSWDSSITAITCPFKNGQATWSPCNRFIAITLTHSMKVDILDSVTLQKLQSLEFPGRDLVPKTLAFSPDSRVLTASSGREPLVVSWDLQTGGEAAVIKHGKPHSIPSKDRYIAYSTNGKMVAVLHQNFRASYITISIYDVASHNYTHDVHPTSNAFPCGLWTHGESLRFATTNATTADPEVAGPMSITIWEVGFTPGAIKTEVETFFIPESIKFSGPRSVRFPQFMIYPKSPSAPLPVILIHHTSSCNDVLVWDARNSKILLHCQDIKPFSKMAFSSDGRFIAGSTIGSGVHIWKYSPAGYVLHGKLPSPTHTRNTRFLFSPNGESVIIFGGSMANLLHTKNLATPLSDSFVDPPRKTNHFLLEFLPDRPLAAVARHDGRTVTLIDTESGAPQLTIDAGVGAKGLGVGEDTIVVIGDREVITWKLPGRGFPPGVTMSVVNSTQKIVLNSHQGWKAMSGLISPDFRYIVAMVDLRTWHVYSATTGDFLGDFLSGNTGLWFTPDGHNIGDVIAENKATIWKIATEGAVEMLSSNVDIEQGQWGCPYNSSCGYRITDDGWVIGPGGKRLLILPPLWRSQSVAKEWKWSGKFLALLHGVLPEPVVIDFKP